MLKLSIYCTRFQANYSSCTGTSSENYVAGVEALRKKERQMKLSLPPKLLEKLVWVSVISLCKIFIPS
jgi:hypothetical protein